MHHPTTTQKGITNIDICVDDPIATPIVISSLSFTANMIALACSAALPQIGSKMTEIKATDIFNYSEAPCMASTRYPDNIDTHAVKIASQIIASH